MRYCDTHVGLARTYIAEEDDVNEVAKRSLSTDEDLVIRRITNSKLTRQGNLCEVIDKEINTILLIFVSAMLIEISWGGGGGCKKTLGPIRILATFPKSPPSKKKLGRFVTGGCYTGCASSSPSWLNVATLTFSCRISWNITAPIVFFM